MLIRVILCATLALGALGSCGVEIDYIDPPVSLDAPGDSDPAPPDVEPYVELGFLQEQLYVRAFDGIECAIFKGAQGGAWAMPALRTQNLDLQADVSCTLSTTPESIIGDVLTPSNRFVPTPDGFAEDQALLLPVRHRPLSDLYEQSATLRCEVSDLSGNSGESSVLVTLVEG